MFLMVLLYFSFVNAVRKHLSEKPFFLFFSAEKTFFSFGKKKRRQKKTVARLTARVSCAISLELCSTPTCYKSF
jgi:hypothetical protein